MSHRRSIRPFSVVVVAVFTQIDFLRHLLSSLLFLIASNDFLVSERYTCTVDLRCFRELMWWIQSVRSERSARTNTIIRGQRRCTCQCLCFLHSFPSRYRIAIGDASTWTIAVVSIRWPRFALHRLNSVLYQDQGCVQAGSRTHLASFPQKNQHQASD